MELREKDVCNHLWSIGQRLADGLNDAARANGVDSSFACVGFPCSPVLSFTGGDDVTEAELRTLFHQEMIVRGVMVPYVAPSFSHGKAEVDRTVEAASGAFGISDASWTVSHSISISPAGSSSLSFGVTTSTAKRGLRMKVLVVGLGSMGRRRVRNLTYIGGHEVAGVEPDDKRREEVAAEFEIAAWPGFSEGLDWKPDALVISTPPDKHTEYACSAARAGIHFFTEASVVRDGMEELLELVRTERSSRLRPARCASTRPCA